MDLPIFQIDAFASKLFEGNPAAVCPLEKWLPDKLMQSIAAENNLSETAFFVPKDDGYHIRWFTPVAEVDLCGHATLATAYVIFEELGRKQETITFNSRSGPLAVSSKDKWLVMDFPQQPPVACAVPDEIVAAFDRPPVECLRSEDYLIVMDHEEDVKSAMPDYAPLRKLDLRGVIITAKSASYDFVTRFFAPKYGIPEDPVTGSAYTQLAPYWAGQLGLQCMKARQVSLRGGDLICELVGDRVHIYGRAVKYMEGTISIDPDLWG
jgi:predicted PhzF superfamily epimerase YddE/YHI9